MEWQQILGFYHAARLGNFTRAAEATFRTQSALSQQIKALEKELDCLLFERMGKRKLQLTAAGEEFLRFSEGILERYDGLVESLNSLKGIQKGALKIAAPFTTLYHLFPEVLKAYVEQFPHVQLTVLDRPQQKVFELVKSGDIDFGFALESSAPVDLLVRRWAKVETVLLTPIGHPLTTETQVTLSEIVKYPLILPPKSPEYASRLELEERLCNLGAGYHVIMESSNVDLSSAYVEMGLGVAFATVVRDLPILKQRKLEFISLGHYFEPDYVAIVARKNRDLPLYKSAFANMIICSH
ncbi:MAG: LysR family transcriptional regulator [Desulfomonilaceae bacterium]